MTLDLINRRRALAGRTAALCCMFFFVAAVDGIVSRFAQSADDLRLLPGQSIQVNGPVGEGVRDTQDLEVVSDSEMLGLAFDRIHPGYWTGGLLWQGVLTAGPQVSPGTYSVAVKAGNQPARKALAVFRVRIFGDAAALQQSADSIIQRYTGLPPWWVLVILFPLILISAGAVYLCSQQRERLLKQEGKAEIYRINRKDDEYEVTFALGTGNGIHVGSVLTLLDKNGVPVGRVTVKEAYEGDATAVATPECLPRPGFIVATSH
jgi:hypothetical protein